MADLKDFYQVMKYNLIIKESRQWILQYFDELRCESIFSIEGLGTCKVDLLAYIVNTLYEREFVFFKF